jgi:hypothetical protein
MRAIQKSQPTLEGETIGANGRLIGEMTNASRGAPPAAAP